MIRTGSTYRLSASDLAGFLACRHLTSLERQVADNALERPRWQDPLLEVLRERGNAHEAAYLVYLREELKLRVVELSEHGDPEATVTAMHQGADVIAQATLEDESGRWYGRADFLVRVATPSALGTWSYEVVDTKLSADTRGETVLQLCLYTDLVERIQSLSPAQMYVVPPGKLDEAQAFRTRDFFSYYRLVQANLVAALEAKGGATYPEPVPHCDICRWYPHCSDRRRADDHLSLIAGATRLQQRELRAVEIDTMTALATAPLPLTPVPKRGSAESYARAREQARLQHASRGAPSPLYELLDSAKAAERGEAKRGLACLPEPSAGDVFFDFEGDPFVEGGGREYLFGWVEHGDDGEPVYRHLWGLDAAAEHRTFEVFIDQLMERWQAHPELHLYHFGAYEPSAFKRLMGRYSSRERELDALLRGERFVDLHRVVKQSLRAGVERYSLKDLEALHGFRRELDLGEASAQLRAVERALELDQAAGIPAEHLDAVRLYNRDDCLSTLGLRDWLEAVRAEEIKHGTLIPRPALQEGDPPERLDADQKRLRQLFERLSTGLPSEPGERSPEEHARLLLAHLLEWHRREDKASWWEYYRLREVGDEELLDEKGGLAGLEYLEAVGGTPKCPVHRYRFPPQDYDLRRGAELHLCDGTAFGSVEAIDGRARSIDIKKKGKTRDRHPRAVFAHDHVRAGALPGAIERLAAWVAEHGLDTDGPLRAARDLLLRHTPRFDCEDPPGESLVGEGEALGVAANRLALALDRSILPVQGPPGAGKTYMGARMVCALVAAGKKVGITAVSHKVIRNLIDEVQAAAGEQGLSLNALHKVSTKSEALLRGLVEVTDNQKPLAALEDGSAQVVGGTAWLWARPEYAGAVDVLFVDEAGQMALANTVAAAQAAESVVLLGDPQQLEQPMQGSHPEGSDVSALEHLLQGHETMPEGQGLFLGETWRLHPKICQLTSELFYENRLVPHKGCEHQLLSGTRGFNGAGLWISLVEHTGNQSASHEEAARVLELTEALLRDGSTWTDRDEKAKPLTWSDLLIVAPYNAQVAALAEHLPAEARVGTVDKFQGQEAPVVIYSMATSTPEDAPRGMEFLYSLHRLNVATSRARCACILVASPRILEPECRTPKQMRLANALCRFQELCIRRQDVHPH